MGMVQTPIYSKGFMVMCTVIFYDKTGNENESLVLVKYEHRY